jgi:hypothetical protein
MPPGLADRILEGSSDAIVVCDTFGRLRFWNVDDQART